MIFLNQNVWIGVNNEGLDITISIWIWAFYFKASHTTAWTFDYTVRWGSYIWPAWINYKPCFYRKVLMFFRDNINIGSSGIILVREFPISSNTSEFIFMTNFFNQRFSWVFLICLASKHLSWLMQLFDLHARGNILCCCAGHVIPFQFSQLLPAKF